MNYIRNNLQKLEQVHAYTDLKTEMIGMDKIWNRISDSGCSIFALNDDVFKNIVRSNDKSMDSGVKNLINAVFCACLI